MYEQLNNVHNSFFPFFLVVIQAQWEIHISHRVMSRSRFQSQFVKRQQMVHLNLKLKHNQEKRHIQEEAKLCHQSHWMLGMENFRVEYQQADHLHLLSKSNAEWSWFRHAYKMLLCVLFWIPWRETSPFKKYICS